MRIWFPQIEGVVLATDQEVVIMCKPASPTIIENRAAGFAGSLWVLWAGPAYLNAQNYSFKNIYYK